MTTPAPDAPGHEDEIREAYDRIPYPSRPWRYAHPVHVATLAHLRGLPAADPARCRLLEIGCADGGNLLPLAAAYPESEFVGVDLSPGHVERALGTAESAGIQNVRLSAMSLVDIGAEFGEFDYILAHGVVSWVPEEVREALLRVCRERLAPSGSAVVSYNAYPGWHLRRMVREVLLRHTGDLSDIAERVTEAKRFLEFLAEEVPGRDRVYSLAVEEVLRRAKAGETDLHYFAHEYLEPANHPFYFREFVDLAVRHGLAYVGDADHAMENLGDLPRERAERLLSFGDDRLVVEQNLDYLRGRLFRQSLLCRDDVEVLPFPDLSRLPEMFFSARLKPERVDLDVGGDEFAIFVDEAGATTRVAHPLSKAALLALGAASPGFLSFPDLAAAARERLGPSTGEAADPAILAAVLGAVWRTGMIELTSTPYPFTLEVASRPRTSPLARHLARLGGDVTNLRHRRVDIDDEDVRRVLILLDGRRDRTALLGELPAGTREADLERRLDVISGLELLTA